jgi:hypothetical protein
MENINKFKILFPSIRDESRKLSGNVDINIALPNEKVFFGILFYNVPLI